MNGSSSSSEESLVDVAETMAAAAGGRSDGSWICGCVPRPGSSSSVNKFEVDMVDGFMINGGDKVGMLAKATERSTTPGEEGGGRINGVAQGGQPDSIQQSGC